MATFKICVFRHQQRRDGKFPISIRVTWKRQSAYIRTEFYAVIAQINQRKGLFELKDTYIINKLNERILEYEKRKLELPQPIETYSAKQLAEELQRVNRIDLYEIIDTYRQRCKPGRQRFVDLVVRTLKEMRGNQLYIDEVNHQLIENYIAYLETPRPISTGQGTIRSNAGVRYPQKYVGVIQAAFNLYKRDHLNFNANFPKIEMKKEVPPHKALTLEEVRKLYFYTPTKKNEQIAKDVFFLSFFLVGINLVDLFTLPPLKGGKVGYCRSKTREKRVDNAYIEIKVSEAAQFIIDQYRGKKYLLNFAEVSTLKNFQQLVNKKMRKIGEELGFERPLSYYYARHTWATLARNKCGYTKGDVAEALNHSNSTITDSYIVRDFSRIDKMNEDVTELIVKLS